MEQDGVVAASSAEKICEKMKNTEKCVASASGEKESAKRRII